MNEAIATAFEKGVLTVTISGNSDKPAADFSPGSAPAAITVGGIEWNWARWTMSNYGPEVDLFAPAAGVNSSIPTADDAYDMFTGTSMAAPHVAGVALYLMALEGGGDAASISKRILELATPDHVDDTKGSENLIVSGTQTWEIKESNPVMSMLLTLGCTALQWQRRLSSPLIMRGYSHSCGSRFLFTS